MGYQKTGKLDTFCIPKHKAITFPAKGTTFTILGAGDVLFTCFLGQSDESKCHHK